MVVYHTSYPLQEGKMASLEQVIYGMASDRDFLQAVRVDAAEALAGRGWQLDGEELTALQKISLMFGGDVGAEFELWPFPVV
jgi:hypothetical protein